MRSTTPTATVALAALLLTVCGGCASKPVPLPPVPLQQASNHNVAVRENLMSAKEMLLEALKGLR